MRFVRWITCGVLLLASAATHAQTPPSTQADQLFEEGRALAKAGNYVEACDRFSKSLTIERTVGTELNLADCQEQLKHFREAWGLFVAAAGESEAAGESKRATFARERAAALEPKMTTMIVKVAQPALPGLVITISGRATQPAEEIHEHADPGDIDVIATAPNLPHFKKTETGVAGATVVVEVPPLDTTVAAPIKHDTLMPVGDRERGRVYIAYGLGAGAAAAGIAAVAFTLVGRNHYNQVADGPDCDRVTGGIRCNAAGNAAIADAQHLADLGTVFTLGGVALAGAAAIVYFTAPRDPIAVTPTATAQSVGLSVSGSF